MFKDEDDRLFFFFFFLLQNMTALFMLECFNLSSLSGHKTSLRSSLFSSSEFWWLNVIVGVLARLTLYPKTTIPFLCMFNYDSLFYPVGYMHNHRA